MSKLSPEAEAAIEKYNVTLTSSDRTRLAKMDSDRQVKWVVNPFIQYCIESFINQSGGSSSNVQSEQPKQPAKPDAPKPTKPDAPKPKPAEEEDDTTGATFDLFG